MRQALVTGATGGLGAILVGALLRAGYGVRATGRDVVAGAALRTRGAAFTPADLTDPSAADALTSGVNVVFHAAALSSPWGSRAAFEAINIDATRRLLASARANGADAFIFISTPSVYAEPRDRLGLTEQSPLARRFANAYVATKYAAETLVRDSDAPGFATVTLRPRAIVGPYDRTLLPRLLRVARTGRFPLFREGRALIDLTDARDVAEAAVAADRGRERVGGKVFNITGGEPASVIETLTTIFDALGKRVRFVRLPYSPAALVCRWVEVACARLPGRPEPPATPYTLSTLAFSQTFDLSGATAALGWRPKHTPWEAISWTAEAWRRRAPV